LSDTGAPVDAPSLTALYRAAIRRHSADPCGYGRPIEATHTHEEYNALCGDRVSIRLQVEDGSITDAAFEGEACAICTASASLLCELAPGETVEGVRRLAMTLSEALRTSTSAGAGLPEALHPLLGVRPYPSRVRCATLPWEAAVTALDPH
jgi:nitrogen fixation NifU-like protein